MRALCLALVLAGCAAQPSAPLCPALTPYTRAEQHALALELPHDGPVTTRAIQDWTALRAAVRACSAKS